MPPNLPGSPPARHPSWSRDWRRQQLVHEGDVGDCQTEGFNSGESLLVGESGNLKANDQNIRFIKYKSQRNWPYSFTCNLASFGVIGELLILYV